MTEAAATVDVPTEVEAALARVAGMVEREAGGWRVDGEAATTLADALYERWYVRADDAPGPPVPVPADPPVHRVSLLSAFRAAHAAAATVEPGWTVTDAGPRGRVVAATGERARYLRAGEYRAALRPGAPPAPGEHVAVVARLDQVDPETALWWAFTVEPPAAPLGRIYLDVRPACAPRAVHVVTGALAAIPHQLKCPVHVAACERVDTMVIYHARAARGAALEALLACWPSLGLLLAPAIPPLTRGVRPGLAWADDPGGEVSFGQSRCASVAGALEDAAGAWAALGDGARVERLLEGLRAGGVDPAAPWVVPP